MAMVHPEARFGQHKKRMSTMIARHSNDDLRGSLEIQLASMNVCDESKFLNDGLMLCAFCKQFDYSFLLRTRIK